MCRAVRFLGSDFGRVDLPALPAEVELRRLMSLLTVHLGEAGWSMITTPNMSLAMCADMGMELQWYIQMPPHMAVDPKVSDLTVSATGDPIAVLAGLQKQVLNVRIVGHQNPSVAGRHVNRRRDEAHVAGDNTERGDPPRRNHAARGCRKTLVPRAAGSSATPPATAKTTKAKP